MNLPNNLQTNVAHIGKEISNLLITKRRCISLTIARHSTSISVYSPARRGSLCSSVAPVVVVYLVQSIVYTAVAVSRINGIILKIAFVLDQTQPYNDFLHCL